MSFADQIIQHADKLPTLPTAVMKLSQLIADQQSSAGDFEKVIKPDPALTANLLRIANSAFFSARIEITSVRQSITRLGVKRVYELATSAGFAKVIPEFLPGYRIKSNSFWRHCVAVAIISEHLAQELKFGQIDFIFTAGLLHDIGKMAIGGFIEKNLKHFKPIIRGSESTFIEAERQVLGTDHAEIGIRLAKKWNLPEAIGLVIRWHHTPNSVDNAKHQRLIDLIHFSNNLAHTLGYGADMGELARYDSPEAAKRLGVSLESVERVATDTIEEIEEMSKNF